MRTRKFRLWHWVAPWDECGHWHRTKAAAERCIKSALGSATDWKSMGVVIRWRAR